MRKILLILTTVLAVGNLFGGDIKISSLPFTITTPGTYVLSSNLSLSGAPPVQGGLSPIVNPADYAITINTAAAGPVILNLKGYTLSGNYVAVAVFVQNTSNATSTTIENGTLQGFDYGVVAGFNAPSITSFLSNVDIENITFYGDETVDVLFSQVNSSTVSNCTFIGAIPGHSPTEYGIEDGGTQTGNRYSNNSFDDGQSTELAVSSNSPIVLKHCHFEPPTN
jgi:hypothetical protein